MTTTEERSGLPTPSPVVTEETAPFWEAAAEGRWVLPRCRRCGGWIWYPRRFCPDCASRDVEWVEASGRGTVYTFTRIRRGRGPWAEHLPYVVAYVELDEGPRVLTNIVGCDPDDVHIGMPVQVVFEPADDGGGVLYRFRPAGGAPGDG